MIKVPMTERGYDQLKKELQHLMEEKHPEMLVAVAWARSLGESSENIEYQTSQEELSILEKKITGLEERLTKAEIIDPEKLAGEKKIKFGATVTVEDEDTGSKKTYQLVGVDEAEAEKGLLSITSPLSRALISKQKGDTIDLITPAGEKSYKILNVTYQKVKNS